MTLCSKLLTGVFLTLASAFGWSGAQAQQAAASREQPRLSAIWHADDAADLVSGYQGEIK